MKEMIGNDMERTRKREGNERETGRKTVGKWEGNGSETGEKQ